MPRLLEFIEDVLNTETFVACNGGDFVIFPFGARDVGRCRELLVDRAEWGVDRVDLARERDARAWEDADAE